MSTTARKSLVVAALFLVTLAVFWQAGANDFVNYDDPGYVTANARVQAGLSLANVRWAFTATEMGNWHPLAWLSHMADCQLFGVNPRGHHLESVLWHAVNAALLFLLLFRLTGALWKSAFAAALFALHPLHVESVAWVSERKDLLSTLFLLLTLFAYRRYAERPGWGRYLVVFILFALGLMAKPMLVTLPFVLLLFDFWPLGRGRDPFDGKTVPLQRLGRLVLEKLPLLLLSVASSVVTMRAQQAGRAVTSLEAIGVLMRVENAAVAYLSYLGKMLWPTRLVILYPIEPQGLGWRALAALAVLVLVAAAVLLKGRRYPYLPVGWLWFLGTLVPVIGLVQVGYQAIADRYTYIPLIGVFIIVAWGIPDLLARWRYRQEVLVTGGISVLVACALLTVVQIGYWKDSVELFSHAVAHTRDNCIAHFSLANALYSSGRTDEAIEHYREALRILPTDTDTLFNLGILLTKKGRLDEAAAAYREALRLKPDFADAHFNLGILLAYWGDSEGARREWETTLRIVPGHPGALARLGGAAAEPLKP